MAAQMMRRILINHALAKKSTKRGALNVHIHIDGDFDMPADSTESDVDVVAIHRALEKLELLDAKQANVVELRYFGGLSIEETALALNISPATVKREWVIAKVWLRRELDNARK